MKTNQRWSYAALAVTGIFFYLLILLFHSGLFLREASFDVMQRAQRRFFSTEAPDVFVVNISEQTMDRFSQDPIPRRYYAQLIDQLVNAHVKAIVMDLMVYNEDPDSEDDRLLRQSIKRAGNVYLVAELFREEFAFGTFHRLRQSVFSDVASGFGYAQFPIDRDGQTRRANTKQLLMAMDRHPVWMQSLARQSVLGIDNAARSEKVPEVIYLNFPTQSIPKISMEDAVEGSAFRAAPDLFAGKVAVIGSSLQRNYVSFQTIEHSEADLLAIEIQNYLSKNWIVEQRSLLSILAMLLGMVALAGLMATQPLPLTVSLGLLYTLLMYVAAGWQYRYQQQFFPFMADGLVFAVYMLALIVLRLVLAELRSAAAKRELDRRQQTLNQMETLGMLASEIVHDIGSPVALISTDAQVLQRKFQETSAATQSLAVFERMQRNVERVMTVVNRIKLLGRPQQSAQITHSLISLKHCLEEALALVAALAKKSELTLDTQWQHQADQIKASENELIIAFTNLLTNAIQASAAGTTVSIQTRTRSARELAQLGHGQLIEILIRDQGGGIAPDKMDDIFMPFFTTKKEGTGLGLYTARRTILDHGGTITVQSTLGKGTTFQILLPRV